MKNLTFYIQYLKIILLGTKETEEDFEPRNNIIHTHSY